MRPVRSTLELIDRPDPRRWLALAFAVCLPLFGLSACGDEEETPAVEAPDVSGPPQPTSISLTRVGFDTLPGWTDDALAGVHRALSKSCDVRSKQAADTAIGNDVIPMVSGDWSAACGALDTLPPDETEKLAAFLEGHFTPFAVSATGEDAGEKPHEGLFTGYFEAEVRGSRTQSDLYSVPLYTKPTDLVTVNLGKFDSDLSGHHIVGKVSSGTLVPYPERGEIEAGSLSDQGVELFWLDDAIDAFLLHVQGSGRVILPDGDVARIGFAAHNGRRYKSIGRALIDRGALKAHEASWNGIRNWIAGNPDKAAELFAVNPRFIFFREIEGDGPIGSLGVALTPERSLAVDRRFIPLGLPLWLDTVMPGGSGEPLRRLMVAQDTGGAIKGVVRGDFFWGYGAPALAKAGKMKSRGRYFLLLPNPAADRQVPPAS